MSTTNTASPSSGLGCRLLVVDDAEDTRALYAQFFRRAGFEVSVAADGAEAVELARATPPNVVLMDMELPQMDGWEATRRLKRDPRTRDAWVIAITGRSAYQDRSAAERAGCDAILTKPCSLAMIDALVQRFLKSATAP